MSYKLEEFLWFCLFVLKLIFDSNGSCVEDVVEFYFLVLRWVVDVELVVLVCIDKGVINISDELWFVFLVFDWVGFDWYEEVVDEMFVRFIMVVVE